MKRSGVSALLIWVGMIWLVQLSCHSTNHYKNSIGMNMIEIPGGVFMMGDSSGNWDELPIHKVQISKSFYISEEEVTIEQFSQFDPNYAGFSEYAPFATGISWYQANEFCKWLSEKENKNYRLPTESEWEYVCRNRDVLAIKNMLNSTLEWCYDWYGPYPYELQIDPVGAENSFAKVVRGGLPDIFIKEYAHANNFYYRPANRAGIAPSFNGFSIPLNPNETNTEVQKNMNMQPGLAGIIYDDLKMKKPLSLYSLPIVNSERLKWIQMNNWAAKWQGYIESRYSGQVLFEVECDNQIELTIGDNIVLKKEKISNTNSGSISLEKGKKYRVKIKYIHDGGESILKLFWSWDGKSKETIPDDVLFHSDEDKSLIDNEYRIGIFSRYVDPSIGFRIVQAPEIKSLPVQNEPPFAMQFVRQKQINVETGPQQKYFRRRFLHPIPPDNSTLDEIILSGLHPSLGNHNHHASLVVCPNGDLLAAYFTSEFEDAPEVSLMVSRLRFGTDAWDMPSPLIDFPDVNDVSPLFWNDGNKIYLFWGNIHLKGGYPFQWVESTDNGATFSEVKFPKIIKILDGFEPQPITSIFRDKDGTIFLACDGVGAKSMLWASKDNLKTWYDTGGRTGGRHTAVIPMLNGDFLGLGGKKSDIDGFMPISVSKDKGKTWKVTRSVFPSLGGGQRPALIRLQSGRILFAGDFQRKDGFQPKGITQRGAFVALSGDEGKNWMIKNLPGTLESAKTETAQEMQGETIGYVSLAQSQNGIIHLATSKNEPALHFEFNEAWILNDKIQGSEYSMELNSNKSHLKNKKTYQEKYLDGSIKAQYSGGISKSGRFLLDGKEMWYYENGNLEYEAEYQLGKKIHAEIFYLPDGTTSWEKMHEEDKFTWIQYWSNGNMKSKSQWTNMRCDGPAIHANQNGEIIKEVNFINGSIRK